MKGQIWILYRRPAEVAEPRDWPAPFVARRWEVEGGVPVPSADLLGADTLEELAAMLPPGLEVKTRTPEDEDSIIETRVLAPPEPVLAASDDGRLTSGMKVAEAVSRARAWWDRLGRRTLRRDFNTERRPARLRTGGPAPAIRVPGEVVDVLPSGLLRGLPWAMLTRQEKVAVVRAWHHEFVVKPELPVMGRDGKIMVPAGRHHPTS